MTGYRLLEKVSLIYASLPCLVFIVGWLKPVFSVPLAAVLAAGVVFSLWQSRNKPDPAAMPLDEASKGSRSGMIVRYLLIAFLVALVVAFSGVGGYSFQVTDYAKHNAFSHDLVTNPWPLAYAKTGLSDRPGTLNTYFGYYLPTAAVGKLGGWVVAQHFSYLWATLGVFLTVLWFLRFVGRPSPLYALLFVFFGGVDILGALLTSGWPLDGSEALIDAWMPTFATGDGEQVLNGVFFLFPGNFRLLTDAPHHILPAWLCIFMLLHDAAQRESAQRLFFLWALVPLNSAFVAVGMAPYVLLSLYETRFKKAVSFPNLVAAPLILLLSALFFMSNNGEFARGWLWEFQDIRKSWPHLLLYYTSAFGLYVLCCPLLQQPANARWRVWWYTSTGCLLLLPWYRMGEWCDFTTKGAIASGIVFLVCLAVALRTAGAQKDTKSLKPLVLLLCLGSLGAVSVMAQALEFGLDMRPRNERHIMRVDELEPKDTAAQLFSGGSSFFWRVLARKAVFTSPQPLVTAAEWDFVLTRPDLWGWLFACEKVEQTAEGAVFRKKSGGPLLRLANVAFPANQVAAVALTIKVYRVGDPQKKTVDFKNSIVWSTERDTVEPSQEQLYSSPVLWFNDSARGNMVWVSQSHAWRGMIHDICIYIDLPEDDEEYEICVAGIQFLSR